MASQPFVNQPFVSPKTGLITREWLAFLQQLAQGGTVLSSSPFVLRVADATLTNSAVLTDTATVTWDFSTPGEAQATAVAGAVAVVVDPAGALDGDGTTGDALAVRVDGVTITINGSNQLEAASSGITALTGDVTAGPGSGSQAATIPNNTVAYAQMQNVSAAERLLGRGEGGGSGDVEELSLGTGLSLSGTVLSASGVALNDYVVASDGGTPPTPLDDGAGQFIYVAYTP